MLSKKGPMFIINMHACVKEKDPYFLWKQEGGEGGHCLFGGRALPAASDGGSTPARRAAPPALKVFQKEKRKPQGWRSIFILGVWPCKNLFVFPPNWMPALWII